MAGIVDHQVAQFLVRLAVGIMVPRHLTGVTLACFDDRHRILMLRHVFHPSDIWDLPGGWLERNESPADCALRELREETGLAAALGPVIHIAHQSVPDHIIITYMARVSSDTDLMLSSEILEASWFSASDLPQHMRPSTRNAIAAAMDWLPGWQVKEQLTDV